MTTDSNTQEDVRELDDDTEANVRELGNDELVCHLLGAQIDLYKSSDKAEKFQILQGFLTELFRRLEQLERFMFAQAMDDSNDGIIIGLQDISNEHLLLRLLRAHAEVDTSANKHENVSSYICELLRRLDKVEEAA